MIKQSIRQVTISEKILTSLIVSLFFSLTLFLFLPCAIYFTNISEFTFSFSEIFGLLILAAFLSTVVLFAVSLFFYPEIIALVFIISVLLWLQGNIMVWDYGFFDGREIDWNRHLFKGFLEIAIWILFILAAFKKPAYLSKTAKRISLFFIAVQLVSITIVAFSVQEPDFKEYVTDHASEFKFSSKKNIIILVLDAFQSDIYQEIIDENIHYKDIFNGFTYFRNALAAFPTTYVSVTVILTGLYYDNSMPIQKFKEKAFLSPSSIPKVLKDIGFEVDLFPDRQCEIYFNEKIASNIKPKKKIYDEYHEEKIRTTVKDLYDITLFRCAPHFIKKYIYNGKIWPVKKTGAREASIKNTSSNDDLLFFMKMERSSETISDKNVFKYFHRWGLHPPFVLNEKLEFIKLTRDRQGCKIHGKGVLELTKKFLDSLKRIGAYDNSLIFIIGDHGLGQSSLSDAEIKAMKTSALAQQRFKFTKVKWSACPLVLVKPFGADGEMKISDAPVCLSDIPSTIASQLGIENSFPGISMFENREPANRNRMYYMYHWVHGYFDRDYLQTMEEYIVSGHSWNDESWRPTGRHLNRPVKK